MGLIGKKEKKILKKYSTGRIVDEADMPWLKKFENTGIIKFGYSPKLKKLTAKTTHIAHSHIM